jgi:hypothetical protein
MGGCAGAGCAAVVFTGSSAGAPTRSRVRKRRRDLLVRFGSRRRGAFTGRTREDSLGGLEKEIHREIKRSGREMSGCCRSDKSSRRFITR